MNLSDMEIRNWINPMSALKCVAMEMVYTLRIVVDVCLSYFWRFRYRFAGKP